MKIEFGKLSKNSSRWEGEVVFTPDKFTEPPNVICQVVRTNTQVNKMYFWYNPIQVINFTKYGFKCKTSGNFQPGDQIHWMAVGN